MQGGSMSSSWGLAHNSSVIIDSEGIVRFVTSQTGTYSHFLTRDIGAMKAVLDDLTESLTIIATHNAASERIAITQAAPNPFNRHTNISYTIGTAASGSRHVLTVYDLLGRTVSTIVDGELPAGRHTALWNGRDASNRQVPTGVYFMVLSNGKAVSRAVRVIYLRD
jgi:flagellar hook assembly protein FlgD